MGPNLLHGADGETSQRSTTIWGWFQRGHSGLDRPAADFLMISSRCVLRWATCLARGPQSLQHNLVHGCHKWFAEDLGSGK